MKETESKKEITTSQLLSFIRKSEDFSEVEQFMNEMGNPPIFHDYLYEVMEKHGCTAKEIVDESRIERSYFYHILSGQKKNPSRNILLRIIFCMHATLNEAQQILRLAATGALYTKVARDAALIFAIENKYTMQQANQFLLRLSFAPLYQEDPK